MIIDHCKEPQSSFLSIEKDLSLITNRILMNENLKKLLYYTTNDAQTRANLTEDETYSLFGTNIKIVPKLQVDSEVLNYIIINFDNFTPNATNPEFRDNLIAFDIICHFDCWHLKDFQLRPYRIAAELDAMLDKHHLTGIGRLQFIGANQIILNDEFAGVSIVYQAINGEEDKKRMLNPEDEKRMIDNFNGMWDEK